MTMTIIIAKNVSTEHDSKQQNHFGEPLYYPIKLHASTVSYLPYELHYGRDECFH